VEKKKRKFKLARERKQTIGKKKPKRGREELFAVSSRTRERWEKQGVPIKLFAQKAFFHKGGRLGGKRTAKKKGAAGTKRKDT